MTGADSRVEAHPAPGGPLTGVTLRGQSDRPAVEQAGALLTRLGARFVREAVSAPLVWGDREVWAGPAADTPEGDWADSGAMAVTGAPEGPPLVAPGAPATAARGAALALAALSANSPGLTEVRLDGAQLLGERAALAGLTARGSISPGGAARMVDTRDGLMAVNLPRLTDRDLVSAWLEVDARVDPWAAVMAVASSRRAKELVERAQLIGLPVAMVPDPESAATDEQWRARRVVVDDDRIGRVIRPWTVTPGPPGPPAVSGSRSRRDRIGHREVGEAGLVVDLSSMWAGPLTANLLGLAGMTVVKVESGSRPDGARSGPRDFFDLLHHGHLSVVVDFDDEVERARLAGLMSVADVIIESSRPRALDHLGLGPSDILTRSPSAVWVSITGYGRRGPWSNRVAFGDDATAAAGMIVTGGDAQAMFCGDALADPLTGLHAAVVALAMRWGGRGGLIDVALRDVAAASMRPVAARPAVSPAAALTDHGWVLATAAGPVSVASPVSRRVPGRAPELGRDTDTFLGAGPGS